MDTRNGPVNFDVAFIPVEFVVLVRLAIGAVVAFIKGIKVTVGDAVTFTGSFFGWATHPVARMQPIAMSRVRSVIVFMDNSPFFMRWVSKLCVLLYYFLSSY